MTKFVLNVTQGQKNTAGEKAKKDITTILKNRGYRLVKSDVETSIIKKILFTNRNVKNNLKGLAKGDLLVIQYPIYSRFTLKKIMNICKKNNIVTLGIIHDVESLRNPKNKKVKSELKLFNQFNYLIVHNIKMMNWLRKNGIIVKMVSLRIFDYLNDSPLITPIIDESLVFAGNLRKAEFLKKWELNLKLKVFGINPYSKYGPSISYRGVLSPDDLPRHIGGSFGLVWDGNSMVEDSGVYGKYIRYNNPHKASLYLSSGLPVVVWKKAAIANFVETMGVGLSVNSLLELPDAIHDLSNDSYNKMCDNARKLALHLRNGDFTVQAIRRAITSEKY